ncbi:Na+/H+ antiporter subunit A [Chengkuizengella axinellae]|uniref:Na+/H+ antiporter subunit A n=1 Tax=Chengkuizengella axinellae TaxID=3064388 RepID=A0ABT9ITU1_9BACL|nr:Na+/H+ antiporter subunit A [Chengkuizengella sp. 2205SS18-9]MDP5272750.1 Na+/H+ antiporter subunit A [Chengkuizengella sp. 2205SS18-9]
MSFLHYVIILPFIFVLLVPFLYKYFNKIHTGWFILTLPIGLFSLLMSYLPTISDGQIIKHDIGWIPSLDIHFSVYLDGLGLLFSLLITGIGSLVVLYSVYYLSKESEKLNTFYTYLLLFMGAMLGVVLSDNIIVLYLFWELTSISSFLLIAYWYKREKSRYGAQKSMLITVFGGLAMLAGFILMYIMSDTFSIREMISQIDTMSTQSLFVPAMLLILLGAFTKSAQFPFHIWLPDAMEAPTPVSAYLHSATMVKAGLYLVARFSPIFAGQGEWFWLVTGFGIVTLFWGSFNAVRQTDLKSILAFSTVSQLGMIMSLLGIGSLSVLANPTENAYFYAVATTAAIFHLINHATFKGALFMMVGIVDHETGTRDIRKLGGLMSLMPITFTIALIGTFSMAGLPPFNGFLSKEMFFTGVKNVTQAEFFNLQTWGILIPVLAWIASIFTFVYSMMIVFKTFTGKHQPEKLQKKAHEAPFGMLIPPIILVSLVIVFGIFPNILTETILLPTVTSILPSVLDGYGVVSEISHWHGWNLELFMTIGVIAIGTLLYLTMKKWKSIYKLFPDRFSFNRFYDRTLVRMEKNSNWIMRKHMTGYTRDYLVYIFSFIIMVLGYVLIKYTTFIWPAEQFLAPIQTYEWILAISTVLAAAAILKASSRLTAIILIGVVGYMVSLFFVIFRAPDLALTQLVVETISVALFLLCFYHLPELRREMRNIRFRITNLLISIGVGVIITFIALSVQGVNGLESISRYFVENSYKKAGGDNIVNVILVDFRGFDTMLEIIVLGIASLGVYSLIKLRLEGRDSIHENK